MAQGYDYNTGGDQLEDKSRSSGGWFGNVVDSFKGVTEKYTKPVETQQQPITQQPQYEQPKPVQTPGADASNFFTKTMSKASAAASTPEPIPEQKAQLTNTSQQYSQSSGGQRIDFSTGYQQGYKFRASDGPNSLGGQCAWFAEQITRLPSGGTWTIGSSVPQKKAQMSGHVKRGNGFYKGSGSPTVGNSIVYSGGTWGHVVVINEILPDGRARITEANQKGRLSVRHDRIVDLNAGNIIGFLKTKPTSKYSIQGSSSMPQQQQQYNYQGDIQQIKDSIQGGDTKSAMDQAILAQLNLPEQLEASRSKLKQAYQNFEPEHQRISEASSEYGSARTNAFANHMNQPMSIRVAMANKATGRAGSAWQTAQQVLGEKKGRLGDLMGKEQEQAQNLISLLGLATQKEAGEASKAFQQQQFDYGKQQDAQSQSNWERQFQSQQQAAAEKEAKPKAASSSDQKQARNQLIIEVNRMKDPQQVIQVMQEVFNEYGVNTLDELRVHDKEMAEILKEAYGKATLPF